MRKDADRARHHGACFPKKARLTAERLAFSGTDLTALRGPQMERLRGARMSMIFQEPMTSLNPGLYDWRPVVRDPDSPSRGQSSGSTRTRDPSARARRNPGSGTPARAIPPRALRRPAPAGDDRDGAHVRAAAHHRRRADHRPWTSPFRPRSCTCWPSCSARCAWRSFSSPTISESWRASPIGWRSCTREKWWRRAAPRTSSTPPLHPYTQGLLACIPVPGRTARGEFLGSIPGMVPSLIGEVHGCSFRNRCPHGTERCARASLELKPPRQRARVSVRARP